MYGPVMITLQVGTIADLCSCSMYPAAITTQAACRAFPAVVAIHVCCLFALFAWLVWLRVLPFSRACIGAQQCHKQRQRKQR